MAFRPTDGSLYLSCSKVVGCITPRTVEGGARRTARVASSAPAAACVAQWHRGRGEPQSRPGQLKRLLEKFGALCWEIALFTRVEAATASTSPTRSTACSHEAAAARRACSNV
eukprot:scaffold29193_cov44-Phaeocystis_antarctica.AAC.2